MSHLVTSCWWAASCGTWPLQLEWWWIATACALALPGKQSGNDLKFQNALWRFEKKKFAWLSAWVGKNSRDSQEHISSGRSSRRKTDTKCFLLSVGKESRFLQVACCACRHQPLVNNRVVVYIKHTARVTAHNDICCRHGCDKHPQCYSFRSPALKSSAHLYQKHSSIDLITAQNNIRIVPCLMLI